MRFERTMNGSASGRSFAHALILALWITGSSPAQAQQVNLQPSGASTSPVVSNGRMPPPQPITSFAIDRTEVTIGEVDAFAQATGFVSQAEREGGGYVFNGGWVRRPGWTWRTPFGVPASADEPAVHLSFAEAQAVCLWRGMKLPTDAQWVEAGHTERRPEPPPEFEHGRSYPYPTGNQPEGANCLGDCGQAPTLAAQSLAGDRGRGHARAGQTKAGVNGLFDMGANAWEWVDEVVGAERRTRGGSWWYGAAQMHVDHRASKPGQFFAVYVGFRCVRDL
jgi:formylglycine-generating enzyme required for sulfatase activity